MRRTGGRLERRQKNGEQTPGSLPLLEAHVAECCWTHLLQPNATLEAQLLDRIPHFKLRREILGCRREVNPAAQAEEHAALAPTRLSAPQIIASNIAGADPLEVLVAHAHGEAHTGSELLVPNGILRLGPAERSCAGEGCPPGTS